MIALVQISEARVQDVTEKVFARAHFARDRSWLDGFEVPLPDWSPRVWWTLVAIALALIVVSAMAQWIPRAGYTAGRAGAGPSRMHQDGWQVANELATRGDYAAALHALFGALVWTLGRAQEVDPHPAKTVGDYARELSARRSMIAAPFRDFAARYERTLYAGTMPDREAYESLARMAQPLAAFRRTSQ